MTNPSHKLVSVEPTEATVENVARAIYDALPNFGMEWRPNTAGGSSQVRVDDPWEAAPDRHDDCRRQARAALAADPHPASGETEPVLWVSSKQMPTLVQGGYVAARAAPEGNFDMPLYAVSPSPVPAVREALRVLLEQVDGILGQLGPGGYLLPSGAQKTNVLQQAANEARTVLQSQPDTGRARSGIYVASKTKHAGRWRSLRDSGVPINSTWIDEAGEGESHDLADLWNRCLAEASNASAIIVYREPDDILKGGWVELGAAASHGVPVFAVGLTEYTISKHRGIHHFDTFDEALAAALAVPSHNGGE